MNKTTASRSFPSKDFKLYCTWTSFPGFCVSPLLNLKHDAVLHICVCVSYRTVLVFSLILLWLCSNGGRLGLVPRNLQHAAFKLSSLVSCLEKTQTSQFKISFNRFGTFKIIIKKNSGQPDLISSHVTYILCFTSCLKGHDDAVCILITDILDLTKFLRLKRSSQVYFQYNFSTFNVFLTK